MGIWTPEFGTSSRPQFEFWGRLDQLELTVLKKSCHKRAFYKMYLIHLDMSDSNSSLGSSNSTASSTISCSVSVGIISLFSFSIRSSLYSTTSSTPFLESSSSWSLMSKTDSAISVQIILYQINSILCQSRQNIAKQLQQNSIAHTLTDHIIVQGIVMNNVYHVGRTDTTYWISQVTNVVRLLG